MWKETSLHGYNKPVVKCVISFVLKKAFPLMWKAFMGSQSTRYSNDKSLIHYLISRDKICFWGSSTEVRVMPKTNSLVKYCLEKIPFTGKKQKEISHCVTVKYLVQQEKQGCGEAKVAADLRKKIKVHLKTSALALQNIRVMLVVLAKNTRWEHSNWATYLRTWTLAKKSNTYS